MKVPKMNLYYYFKIRNFFDTLANRIRFNSSQYRFLLGQGAEE